MNNIINYLYILVLLVSSSIYAEEVEEIIIKADWREAPITDGDTSTFVLSDNEIKACLLYTSPSPRDLSTSRMPSSA